MVTWLHTIVIIGKMAFFGHFLGIFGHFWAFLSIFDVTTGLVTFGYTGYIFGYTNSEVLVEKEKMQWGLTEF